jgi:hypothetical protein
MWSVPPERAAKIGIAVEFAALIRTLAECLRLMRHADIQPYLVGALIAALCAAVSVGLYFLAKYRSAVAVAVAAVLMLIVYKIAVFGWRL